MAFDFTALTEFVFENIYFIAIIGVLGYYAYQFLRIKRTDKIVNRSVVERLKFIERMKENKVDRPMFLYKGKVMLGRITHFKEFFYDPNPKYYKSAKGKGNPDPKAVMKKNPNPKKLVCIDQFVVKPLLFGKIPNPLAKVKVFQIGWNSMQVDKFRYIIRPHVFLDYYFGIYYDESTQPHNTNLIKDDNVIRTDFNQLASIYYVKSQEQSTYDPDHAHQMALREKELQIEMAKRRGKSETV